MSQHDDIDDARAALIDQRIGQAFGFLGDVIEDSRLLGVIPDGSRLAFRDVAIGRSLFRLTAYQPPETRNQWTALVTGYRTDDEPNRSDSGRKPASMTDPRGPASMASSTGKTAPLALEALEAELRALTAIPA